MPALTGHFEADFANFATAVGGVQVKLREFEGDSNKVSASLNRMTDSFSGRQVIQEAGLMVEAVERLGGTAVLTEKELARLGPTVNEAVAKMKLLGMEVPANMAAIAKETQGATSSLFSMGSIVKGLAGPMAAIFSVQAVIQFANEVLDAGDAIQKMADQTQMTTDEVQQLQYVAGQSGSSVESMVTAVQNLQVRLGAGDAGVIGALKRMNINLDEFKQLGTYDQLLQINEGLRGITDPALNAATAAEVLGKNWKELAPAMKTDMRELADAAPKMSQAAVEGLDRMGDAMTGAKQTAVAWAGETVHAIGLVYDKWREMDERQKNFGKTNAEALADQMFVGPKLDDNVDPTGLKRALGAIKPLSLPVIAAIQDIKLSTEDLRKENERLDAENAEAYQRNVERKAAEKALLDEAKRQTEAYWKAVNALVDEAFGTDKLDAAAKWNDAMLALGDDIGKLSGKMRGELMEAMQGGIAAMAANGTLTGDLSTRYTQLLLAVEAFNAKMRETPPVIDAVSGTVTTYTQKLYDAAVAEDRLRDAAAAKNAEVARGWAGLDPVRSGLAGLQGGDDARGMNLYTPTAPSRLPVNASGTNYVPQMLTTYAPGRAAGGPVAAGQSYVVGERGPELFTPGTSGGITPNGATIVQNTFHIVDTEANLARRVSDSILRSITQARRV